jgi:transcription elongation factor GreA
MEKIPMTEEGQKKLLEELKRLKTIERPIIIKAIADARSNGDLSENAEYHAAREKQSFIEGRVAEIESTVAQAEIIDVSKLSGTVIKFGASVSIINLDAIEDTNGIHFLAVENRLISLLTGRYVAMS